MPEPDIGFSLSRAAANHLAAETGLPLTPTYQRLPGLTAAIGGSLRSMPTGSSIETQDDVPMPQDGLS